MPKPLHHSTLAAITKLAQKHGLPLVRADSDAVIVGDFEVRFTGDANDLRRHSDVTGLGTTRWYVPADRGTRREQSFTSPLHALRDALRKKP